MTDHDVFALLRSELHQYKRLYETLLEAKAARDEEARQCAADRDWYKERYEHAKSERDALWNDHGRQLSYEREGRQNLLERYKELEEERDWHREQYRQVWNQYLELKTKYAKLEEERDAYVKLEEEHDKDNDAWCVEYDKLKGRLDKLQREYDELKMSRDALMGTLEDVQSQWAAHRREIRSLKEQNDNLDQENRELKEQLDGYRENWLFDVEEKRRYGAAKAIFDEARRGLQYQMDRLGTFLSDDD